MERLTEWFEDHWGTRTERLNGKLVGNQMCLDKLAEYENLEEQGLLRRLPCKEGDTVWCLTSAETKIVECTVLWIEWHRNGSVVFSLDGGLGDVVLAHLGKTWFLTEEEANEHLVS